MADLILPRRLRRGGGLVLPQSQRGFMVVNPSRFASAGGPLRTGLVSWYDFEDATGAVHVDSVGTNTLGTSATQAAGKVGNCVSIANGSSVSIITSSGVDFLTGDFTIACWVNTASANLGCVSRYQVSPNNRRWALLIEGGVAKFVVSTDGTTTTIVADSVTVNNSAWHLLKGWRSTTDGKIYVQTDNGTPVSTVFSAASTLYGSGSNSMWIGELGGGVYNIGGNFDSTGIWSRELTGAERTTLWNGGAGLNYAAL